MRDVLEALAQHVRSRPNDRALSAPGETLSYATLAERAADVSAWASAHGQVIGILAPNTTAWVACDLGLALAGRTMVPLPPFFSPAQLSHIVHDAQVNHILCSPETQPLAQALCLKLDVPFTLMDTVHGSASAWPSDLSATENATCIIYTSGTTGQPKGVRIGAKQISASAHGLLKASAANVDDSYLSVLPFALLLEQIAAICVPLLAGAPVTLAPTAAAAAQGGDPTPLVEAFMANRPTTSVLVPGLLGAWVQALNALQISAPDSLRFVAVGGAHVPGPLAEAAWNLGIPVFEGYGLSECCSVVSVNRPGQRAAETAGLPLEGLDVSIENGEIVVRGPTVMDGYLGGENVADGTWRTGDLGRFTDDGNLVVLGRRDRMIVTPQGRNIHPEWIETIALGTPGVQFAKLSQDTQNQLVLDISPTPSAPEHLEQLLRAALAEAPEYARPARIDITPSGGTA